MCGGVIRMHVLVICFVLVDGVGDARRGRLCLVDSAVGLGIGLLIRWIKVKETKGVDLANLKGDEFE